MKKRRRRKVAVRAVVGGVERERGRVRRVVVGAVAVAAVVAEVGGVSEGRAPAAEDFLRVLRGQLEGAKGRGERVYCVASGELHREVTGSAGEDRLGVCRYVMLSMLEEYGGYVASDPRGAGGMFVVVYAVGGGEVLGSVGRDVDEEEPLRSKDFERELRRRLEEAKERGDDVCCVAAGAFHREMGMYPGPKHRMATCCHAMRGLLRECGGRIVREPPKGLGASLEIEYDLGGFKG